MEKMNAEPGGAVLPRAHRRINRRAANLAQAPQPQSYPMNPRCQVLSTPQANMKRLHRQNGRGSGPVGKMNAEPGGTALPRALRRINAGRRTWLRLHNLDHNPMNRRRQAFSTHRANMKPLHRQDERGSVPVGKMNAEPGGAVLPHALRRINAGRQNLTQAPQP